MENLFVELIQLSLGNRNSLSQTPSTADWERLYLLANKQTIVGICLYGLQKLPDEQSINLSQALKLGWIALTIQIQENNDIANQRCLELQNKLNDDGFRGLILKGQGVAALYPAEIKQYRQSGDIDVWVDGTREQVIEYAVGIKPSYEFDEKHVHFDCFTDIPVELHWIPVSKWNPKWNRLLKQYFENERERQFSQSCEGPRFPTADFQLTHQLLHVLGHYLSGGIGLRQMMDLYYSQQACIKQYPEKIPEILDLFEQMGLMKLVAATQWVIQEVFCGVSAPDSQLICTPNEKEGWSLLNEIELGGNFGKYNIRNVQKDKTAIGRFWRKWTRLMKYDFLGSIVMPFARLKLEIWIRAERQRLKV